MLSRYFRADVRGIENIPERGPGLLVGNHSGGNVPPDTFLLTLALISRFGLERPFYQLAHDLVMASPVAHCCGATAPCPRRRFPVLG